MAVQTNVLLATTCSNIWQKRRSTTHMGLLVQPKSACSGRPGDEIYVLECKVFFDMSIQVPQQTTK